MSTVSQHRMFQALLAGLIVLTVVAAFSASFSAMTPFIAMSAALLAAGMRRRGILPGRRRPS